MRDYQLLSVLRMRHCPALKMTVNSSRRLKSNQDELNSSRSTEAEQRGAVPSEKSISRRDLQLLPFSALLSLVVSLVYFSIRARSVIQAERAGFIVWSVFLIELAVAGK